jgi:hypothetical protein
MLKRHYLVMSVLLICLGVLGASIAQAAPVGTFIQVEGRVDLLKGAKLPANPVKAQDAIEVGDVVRTKSQSRAQIKFVDNTVLTIAPESRVTIEEYMFDGAKGERKAVLGVLRGLVHTAVEKVYPKAEPDFIMKTHTAVLGVRGTRWFTKILPIGTDVYTDEDKGTKLEVKSIFPEVPGIQLMTDLQYIRVGWFVPQTMVMNITKQDLIILQKQMKTGIGGTGASDPGPTHVAGMPKPPLAPQYSGEPSLIENLSSGAYVPPRIAPPPPPLPPPPPPVIVTPYHPHPNGSSNGNGYPYEP